MLARPLLLIALLASLSACGAEPLARTPAPDPEQDAVEAFALPEGFEAALNAYVAGWGQQ